MHDMFRAVCCVDVTCILAVSRAYARTCLATCIRAVCRVP